MNPPIATLNIKYTEEGFRWMMFPWDKKGHEIISSICSANFLPVRRDYILYMQREDKTPVYLPNTETLKEYREQYQLVDKASSFFQNILKKIFH